MKNLLSGIGAVIMAIVFLAAGVLCIFLGINRIQKLNAGKYTETQATITKIDTEQVYDSDTDTYRDEYKITVEYTVDGKKYVSELGEKPSKFNEGMELTVLYDVDNPSKVILPGKSGSYIMIGLGAVGVIIGIVLILKKIRGR